ncbi:DUF6917 domain-containing protein [Caldinitratiruptor microaerophilus]|uniref:DUF6917 domain-containing protein n=1 Tax=Caldinitratiruptor microaerophilus TaxID=671077 RepID=A0AA35G6J0_9FIRM|nr:hypothetical protein [Caldinitratiruptor microaerophilus]BDG59031.1 hypothetical protein caldi_01210 [Caldinitratiruptor microaerophilus]
MPDPYVGGLFRSSPYAALREITGTVVAVLDARLAGRGLNLIAPISRCLLRDEIHELILTTGAVGPGDRVEDVHYLAFFEVSQGGVAVVGQTVRIAGYEVGRIAGFDETHMPNHMNVVLSGPRGVTGGELGLQPGDPVIISGRLGA